MSRKLLHNVMVAAALALPIISLNAQSALADRRDFTVQNNSGSDIQYLYVSSSSENEWGEDILGQDVLPSGESTEVNFTDESNACRYDIKAVFEDGQSVEDYQVDLCGTASYTFYDKK
ncbi:hypothetical protein [Leptolyngbya sp. FACHB-261]|uniref:hypothetical protein n=1 Tax=Leptolyngbya sp. FACHB-261 TaxID=2692806 RepID=UPI001688F50B|nr:hypothetical protein [Leptolyngbya sp. FACHB-261]MBD2099700.1 hypothetical protein [Leptolyngbya sp. FACHB-261]